MQTVVLIGLFFCHLLADFTHLSTNWMLNAKRLGKPLHPIFVHALVHAILMILMLLIIFRFSLTVLIPIFIFQLLTHFIIDVTKGRLNGFFPNLLSPSNKWHWVLFGVDQYLHSFVIIIMSFYLTK